MVWNGASRCSPGIGDENVDDAELGNGAPEHLLHLGFVVDVRLERESPDTGPADLFGHRFGAILTGQVVHHDIGAGLTQRDRHRLADAGIGAGHQRLLAGKDFRRSIRHGDLFAELCSRG